MRSHALRLGLFALLSLGACTAITDLGRFRGGGGSDAGLDASSTDDDGGSRPDTGPRPDTGVPSMCTPACEPFEDCCGTTCVDLELDPLNCGDCGIECPTRDHSTPACDELGCDYDCTSGFDDCDGLEPNGCETPLNTVTDCGSCGHTCPSGMFCNGDLGTCVTDCAAPRMVCGDTCVDVMGSDVSHCGSCSACPDLENATASCSSGSCRYACTGAFMDCNGDLGMPSSDGCERTPTTYYVDGDRDGYGNAGDVMACSPPPGTSAMGGDCNDGNALVFPGAVEQCNGSDDDCDRTSDETFEVGGVAVGGLCSCEAGAESGRVMCQTSSRSACAYPAESCNGLDDDCDGVDDDGFGCVLGGTSTCTGTGTLAGCSFIGTAACDATCTAGACTAPMETCNAMDEDCDGFADDGRLALGTAMGAFGVSGASSNDHVVAVSWRGVEGGAALIFTDDGSSRALHFQFFDAGGAPASTSLWRLASSVGSSGPTGQAAVVWDGAQWLVFFVYDNAGTTEVRRVTITHYLPGPSVLSTPVTEATGISHVAAARASAGDVGVVFVARDRAMTGVWRGAAWLVTPTATISSRAALEGAAISAVSSSGYWIATSETGGSSPGIVMQPFSRSGPGSVYLAMPGAGISQVQTAFEPLSGRIILAWQQGSNVQVVRWDPSGTLYGGTVALGPGRAPRVSGAPGGDVFVAPGPDLLRFQRDTGLTSGESIAPSLTLDALVGTPGAGQSAIVFYGSASGVFSRTVRCM